MPFYGHYRGQYYSLEEGSNEDYEGCGYRVGYLRTCSGMLLLMTRDEDFDKITA